MVQWLGLSVLSLSWAWGLIPVWEAKWQATPALLPGKSHGWRILVGYSAGGCKESDATEQLHFLYFLSWEAKILETMWCGPKQNETLVFFRKSGPMKAGILAAMAKLGCLPGHGHGHIPEVLESQPASVVSTPPQTWMSYHGDKAMLCPLGS